MNSYRVGKVQQANGEGSREGRAGGRTEELLTYW